jgi:hypothetical protein
VIETHLGRSLLSRVQAIGYIFPLELSLRALENDVQILEIPVTLEEEIYPSNVRLFRDGFKMLVDIFRLRFQK